MKYAAPVVQTPQKSTNFPNPLLPGARNLTGQPPATDWWQRIPNMFQSSVPADFWNTTTTNDYSGNAYLQSGGRGFGPASSQGQVGGYGEENAATTGRYTGQYAYSSPYQRGDKWEIVWKKDDQGNWVKVTQYGKRRLGRYGREALKKIKQRREKLSESKAVQTQPIQWSISSG